MSNVTSEQLRVAFADPERVGAELELWEADPDQYIQDFFARITAYDFPVYAGGNLRIQDKEGRALTFLFNRIQRKLWQWFLEDLASGKPIRWYIIKARQMGVSTWIMGLFYWMTSCRANRNALVVAQDEEATQNFSSRIQSLHAEGHPLLKPPIRSERRDIMHFGNKQQERKKGANAGLDSRLVFLTAGKGELGRSYTFHMAWLSEFAIWPNLGIDVMVQLGALNAAIPKKPGTIVILESTAKGENAAKDIWDDQTNGYRKLFIPWVAYEDYRKEGATIDDICETEEAGGKQTKYGDERREISLIQAQLKIWFPEFADDHNWLHTETVARLAWRREMIDTDCLGDKLTFRREYPTTPQHAFAATSKNCFDLECLDQMKRFVAEEGIQPYRFNYVRDESTNPNTKFQLSKFGPLVVYKPPEPYSTYVIAGDAAQGIPNSGDPSSLVVLNVSDGLEEVASYNAIIRPDIFAEIAFYLGLLYNGALLAIEDNEKGGFAANQDLHHKLRYRRLYFKFDAYDKRAAGKPGFHTTERNKSVMVTELAQLIFDHEILFRSDELINQLEHYMMLKNGTLGAASGFHDDLVSAAMIAVNISNKVHMYPERVDPAPKGSFNWYAQQHARKRAPGLLGYK